MFSGIVEETGEVVEVIQKQNLSVLKIKADKVLKATRVGNSVAVDGVCLTVTEIDKKVLTFDVMLETLRKTTLGYRSIGDRVNLERSLKANSRLDGHFVTGHVDDVAVIKKIITGENYTEFQIGLKRSIARFVAQKGSIAVDGVSLTIGEVKKDRFSVYLIPFTLQVTTLGEKKQGDKVNIEVDILARYILNQKRF